MNPPPTIVAALSAVEVREFLPAALLAELRSLTAEEAWRDSWTGDGNVPDCSRLERRLQTLLDHGQADAVVELGEELLRGGTDQIEESRDDGMTAFAIGGCMDRVAPPRAVEAATARVGADAVRYREMGLRFGDRADYGHVDLLVGRRAPAEIYPQVVDFIEEMD